MKTIHKNTKGFTLIELLVVVAIIGLLASVVLASLVSAEGKARDAKRLSDLDAIRTALELYYNDHGAYPTTNNSWYGTCSTWGSYGTSGAGGYIPNLAPTYISVLPVDPKPNGPSGCYIYNSNGTDYILLAYLTVEESNIPASVARNNTSSCTPSGEPDYAIYSPADKCW